MYGIGGIIIPNGKMKEVKSWVSKNQNRRPEPLIHIASINKIFELPFEGLNNYPGQRSVECYTDDSLVYALGQAHAVELATPEYQSRLSSEVSNILFQA